MATSGPTQLPAYFVTDADFRTWAQAVATAVAAVGLVKTTDTGQVDLTTAVRPLANAYAGYEVYKFNDTLQATKPVFVKIEYGVGGSTDRPSLALTVGTGTNGAGTLNGQVGTRKTLAPGSTATSGEVHPTYTSGSTSRVTQVTHLRFSTNTAYAMGWNVERTKDSTGADTGDGIVFGTVNYNNSAFQVIPFTGTIPAQGSGWPVLDPNAGMKSELGADVAISPPIIWLGKALYALGFVGYSQNDLGAGVAVTPTLLGAAHTYVPMTPASYGLDGSYFFQRTSSATTPGVAMLFE